MSAVLAIARRELEAYFATPVGWLCLTGFILVTGLFFAVMVTGYADQATQAAYNPYGGGDLNINETLLPDFFGNTAVILLLLCPALTMRLFSEDRRQRSFELLLSSPLSSTQIVLGKYLGALGFLGVLLLGTLHYVAILYWVGAPDAGTLLASYAATFLLAASFMAVGMFTSAFTESQVLSLVISFGVVLGLWVLAWIDSFSQAPWVQVVTYASMLSHQSDLSKGLLHIKDLVYFVSFIGFFLFATQQRVEAFRWQ